MKTIYFITLLCSTLYPFFWCCALFGSSLIFLISVIYICKKGWMVDCQKRGRELKRCVRPVNTLNMESGVTDFHRLQ